jgi:hypothetical protein
MRIYIIISYLLINILLLKAQEDTNVIYLNNDGLTLDSLYSTVFDPNISYDKKIELLYVSRYRRDLEQEKQTEIINELLLEGKKNKDYDGILYCYVFLADLYYTWENAELFNLYIDSADMYIKRVSNPLSLARYHYIKGSQAIIEPYGIKEGYKQFELALDYYIMTKQYPTTIGVILYNISVYTANQPDTAFVQRIINKTEFVLQNQYSPFVDFSLSTLKSDYYNKYYEKSHLENMLDSAIFYEKKRINIYFSNRDILPQGLDYDVLQSYLLLAEYYSLIKDCDWKVIDEYIDKAITFGYTDDPYIMSRIKYSKAISAFKQNKLNEAEKLINKAEKYLDEQINEAGSLYQPESFYSDLISCYSLHLDILYQKNDYKNALKYNTKKNKLKLKLREIESIELEYLYNTEKEEREIEELRVINANQFKSLIMAVIAAILLVNTIIFLWLWHNTTKKSIKRESVLIKSEKDEVVLKLKIKEEQSVKALLEKYEVLSDFRTKEIELDDKNKEMEQLLIAKEQLDSQITVYIKKINGLEEINIENEEIKEDDLTYNTIISDISSLISRKLPARKNYVDILSNIDSKYILTLRKAYQGNLSVPYIKYCLCFAIGMEISEVSECFSIEQPSVHMIRYRLKKKFKLDNNDDLNVYLRQLNNFTLNRIPPTYIS